MRLDAVDNVRAIIQKITNGCQRAIGPLARAKGHARDQLLAALQIPEWNTARVLVAVNEKRQLLGLAPLAALTATTSVRDGLGTATSESPHSRIAKAQAIADLGDLGRLLMSHASAEIEATKSDVLKLLQPLAADPKALDAVQRERFLATALNYVENSACPVCDIGWDTDELRALVGNKLKQLEDVARRRTEIEKLCVPLLQQLERLIHSLRTVEAIFGLLQPRISAKPLGSVA